MQKTKTNKYKENKYINWHLILIATQLLHKAINSFCNK